MNKIKKVWAWAIGLVFSAVGLAFVLGIIFWGGFNTAMEWTNTETFCISCHEMEVNVYQEYRNTIHYNNRTGVRAVCSDCHVPKEWWPKMVRKFYASNELLHKMLGSIDTPEKFEAKRAVMAQREWARMKRNDSQECRNCHDFSYFDYAEQAGRSSNAHQKASPRVRPVSTVTRALPTSCQPSTRGLAIRFPARCPQTCCTPSRPAESEFRGASAPHFQSIFRSRNPLWRNAPPTRHQRRAFSEKRVFAPIRQPCTLACCHIAITR